MADSGMMAVLSRVPRALSTVVHSERVARYTGRAELKQVTLITRCPGLAQLCKLLGPVCDLEAEPRSADAV